MTEPTHLAALYNAAPIILWVEDLLTSAYLGALWQNDQRIQMYIGGGHENLAAVVEYACRSNRSRVLSVRDRDFGPTNRPKWRSRDVFNLSLETFEVECFLIDYPSLARCVVNTAQRSEPEIKQWFISRAGEMLWWMACRKVISSLREARQEKFPSHPKRTGVSTRAEAEAILCRSKWVEETVPGLQKRVEAKQLVDELDAAYADYERHLTAGTWTAVFSGKELLEDSLSWIYTRGRPAGPTGLENLAKAVASEQLMANRVPQELLDLHAALIERI